VRGMTLPLDIAVQALLKERRGAWKQVAEASGVSYSWLSKFANGHIENPGYATLSRLFDYLSSTAPDLARAA
jgi:transcriptional regulator with XRE-family HTH domain